MQAWFKRDVYQPCSKLTEVGPVWKLWCSLLWRDGYSGNNSVDNVNKCVYGPAKKVQAVILWGLTSKWKQLIFYDFDVKMTKNLLLTIISKCEDYGIKVHAIVFDMGNHTFMSQFRILDGTNKIKNPWDPSRSVYFFPDAPHLLKLLRNHCLDKGYSFPDGSGNNVMLLAKKILKNFWCRMVKNSKIFRNLQLTLSM